MSELKFRKSIGGFNKQDVISYIDTMSNTLAQHEKVAKEAKDQIDELKAQQDEIHSKVDYLAKENERLNNLLVEKEQVIAEKEGAINNLYQQLEHYNSKMAEYSKRDQEYKQLLPALDEKKKIYDRQIEKLSSLLFTVKKESNTIIQQAKEQVRIVCDASKGKLAKYKEKADNLHKSYIALETFFDGDFFSIDDITSQIDEIVGKTEERLSQISISDKGNGDIH